MLPELFVSKVCPMLWPTMCLNLYNLSFFYSASTAECMSLFCRMLTWLSHGWGPFLVVTSPFNILMIKGLQYDTAILRKMEKPYEAAARGLFVEDPSSVSCLPGGMQADFLVEGVLLCQCPIVFPYSSGWLWRLLLPVSACPSHCVRWGWLEPFPAVSYCDRPWIRSWAKL